MHAFVFTNYRISSAGTEIDPDEMFRADPPVKKYGFKLVKGKIKKNATFVKEKDVKEDRNYVTHVFFDKNNYFLIVEAIRAKKPYVGYFCCKDGTLAWKESDEYHVFQKYWNEDIVGDMKIAEKMKTQERIFWPVREERIEKLIAKIKEKQRQQVDEKKGSKFQTAFRIELSRLY